MQAGYSDLQIVTTSKLALPVDASLYYSFLHREVGVVLNWSTHAGAPIANYLTEDPT